MNSADLYSNAFGDWNPEHDSTSAIKFCLDAILLEGDFDWLVDFLESPRGMQLQGDPGWELERLVEDGSAEDSIRASLPVGLMGVEVDEVRVGLGQFAGILQSMLIAWSDRHPDQNSLEFKRLQGMVRALA